MQSSGNNIHEMVTNNRMQSLINIKKKLKADLSEIIHLCNHNDNNNNDQSEKQKDETRLTRLR